MKLFKKFIIFIIFSLTAIAVFIWFYNPAVIKKFAQPPEYSRSLYQEARDLQKNNAFSAAYYTYGKISPRYKVYDVVLFQQANCAASVGDEKTAIQKYKTFLKSYPDNQIAPLVSYSLGQAYVRSSQPIEAEKQFLYTLNKFPKTDYALGSCYYLGNLYKNTNKEEAAAFWLKYIALAPSGRFALDCYEGLKEINYNFSSADLKFAAIAIFMQEKYSDALEILNRLPESDIWYYKAMCLKSLGKTPQALMLFKKGLSAYSGENTPDRAKIEKAMLAYVALSKQDPEKSWTQILGFTQQARDFALYQRAVLMPLNKAENFYEEIIENYPDGNFASESLWTLFWLEYNSGNYQKALEFAQKHISVYENTKASPKIHFWLGKIYEKEKNTGKAKDAYKNILKKFPDSYYAFRAEARLSAINNKYDPGWKTNRRNELPEMQKEISKPYSFPEIEKNHGPEASELIELGDLETAMLFIKDDPFLESWIKLNNGLTTSSIVTARNALAELIDKPDTEDPKWQLAYPIYYAEEININAALNGLDPVLVLSLLKEESHFNSYAVSSSNALGLMQVLPCTAKDVVRWRRLNSGCINNLLNPSVNIKIGAAYLGHTKDTFDGDMLFSVAAYNAGPGAVKTWLKRNPDADLDRFVENIPYAQTRDYVKKVFGSYWNYKRIYGFN